MATCTKCGKKTAVSARFTRQLCTRCTLSRLTAAEWAALAPSAAMMTAFLLGVSVFLPYETIHLLRILLAQLHG